MEAFSAILSGVKLNGADFPQNPDGLRKQRGRTQADLADRIGMRVVQLRRYKGALRSPRATSSANSPPLSR